MTWCRHPAHKAIGDGLDIRDRDRICDDVMFRHWCAIYPANKKGERSPWPEGADE